MTEPRASSARTVVPRAEAVSPVARAIPIRSQILRLGVDYGLPLLLLGLSVVTTTAIGARFMHNFMLGQPAVVSDNDLWPWPWLIEQPNHFWQGWPFSLTLLTILLTHEFGHYFACRAHGIRATLPWVLPAPTLSGTAGAVIQLRSRIPNRRALVDVGAYGPLAGYLASLGAVVVGAMLSHAPRIGAPPPLIQFGEPLTYRLVPEFLVHLYPSLTAFESVARHPVLIAGWVGLFVTALNLIPGGQLDGGHLLYALTPLWHRRVTRILPLILIFCGVFFWIGWVLWGLILLLPALRKHPTVPQDTHPLGALRKTLCALALVVFILTFSAEPFRDSSILHYSLLHNLK